MPSAPQRIELVLADLAADVISYRDEGAKMMA